MADLPKERRDEWRVIWEYRSEYGGQIAVDGEDLIAALDMADELEQCRHLLGALLSHFPMDRMMEEPQFRLLPGWKDIQGAHDYLTAVEQEIEENCNG